MSGADTYNIIEPEAREFRRQIFVLGMVDLVHDQDDRALGAAQETCELLVDRCETLLRVDGEENDVSLAHCRVGGATHFLEQLGFIVAANPTCVPDGERLGPA